MKNRTILRNVLALAFAGSLPAATATEPPRDEAVALSLKADRPLLHRGDSPQEVIIRIGVRGGEVPAKVRRNPLNLAVVLDRSGSMTGAKLEQARQAAEMLVDRLAPDDVFSLVIYDTEVEVLVPPATVGRSTAEIRRRIRGIEAGGSTALYAGVEAGGRQLSEFFDRERINRVLLLSDGIANVGPSSNREIARLGHELAKQGRSVSTIGLGEDYNEDLMTALAEASDANYYYVADAEALPEVFENELGELQSVVARRLVLEITFPEGVEPLGILGRGESIEKGRGRIAFGTLAAGQDREIYVACRVQPGGISAKALTLASAKLSYEGAAGEGVERTGEVTVKSIEDAVLAERSRVSDITARAEIYRNAAATEQAIALADAGRGDEAKSQLTSQIAKLREVQAVAPAAAAAEIEREIGVLEESQTQLGSDGFSKEGRKALQWNSFNRRNAKQLDKTVP